MKNLLTLLFCTLLFSVAQAQLHPEIKGIAILPTGEFHDGTDYGYGPEISLGYLINDKIDVSIGYDYLIFSSMQEDLKINTKYIMAKYLFHIKKRTPYLGCKFGLNTRSYYVPDETIKHKNAFGFSPQIGLLSNLTKNEKLKLDTSVGFSRILFEYNKTSFLSLEVGVSYFLH
jgi:hypothetical protein